MEAPNSVSCSEIRAFRSPAPKVILLHISPVAMLHQVMQRRPGDLRGGWSYITSRKTDARGPTSGQNTSGAMHRVNRRAKMWFDPVGLRRRVEKQAVILATSELRDATGFEILVSDSGKHLGE